MTEGNMDNEFDRLSKFGLTSYEIKVYRTLLINGPLTSTKVVNLSGVPQPRIYDIFNNMISKGLVEASPGKKKIYKALPVNVALGRKIEELSSDMNIISEAVEKNALGHDASEPLIWIIESEKNIKQKIHEIILGAEHELLICINSEWWKYASKYVLKALAKGVTVAIVLSPEIDPEEVTNLSGAFIRRRKYASSQVIIADREIGLLGTASRYNANYSSVFIEENELIHILNYYFYHTLWKPSEEKHFPLEFEKLNFTTNWFMCDVASEYLKLGKKLNIRVVGKSNGMYVELSGPVVNVEIMEGLRHTLVIQSKGKQYSVGGRSAVIEDVSLTRATMEFA